MQNAAIDVIPQKNAMYDWNDLKSFLAVAESGSTLAAAQALRVSQTTVARRIAALEAAAWGLSEAVTPNALDVALHRIRRKLLVMGSRQQIVNVRGRGYALREDDVAE